MKNSNIKISERPKNIKHQIIYCLKIIEINKIYITKQQRNISERCVTFKRIISIIANFLSCKKWLKNNNFVLKK